MVVLWWVDIVRLIYINPLLAVLCLQPSDYPAYPLCLLDFRSDLTARLPVTLGVSASPPDQHNAHPQAAGVQLCALQAPFPSGPHS